MAIGYPSHGSSYTALSKGPSSTLCGSIIYYIIRGGSWRCWIIILLFLHRMVHRRRQSITHRIMPLLLLRHLLLHVSTNRWTCAFKTWWFYAYAFVNSLPSILPPRTQETQSHMWEGCLRLVSLLRGEMLLIHITTHNAFMKQEVSFKVCYVSLRMKYCLRVLSSAAGPPRTCCVVITGGGLLLLLIYSTRLMRSKIFPPSRYHLPHYLWRNDAR